MTAAPETFVHLHNHTEFSLLDGASRIKGMVARAAELEMPALALTDHGVMYGAIAFYKECKAAGITPILGCELYVAPRSRLSREGRADRDPYHLTVLATSAEGYRNLMRLCTAGQMEGLYYKPRVDRELLAQHAKGLVVLSGCLGGEVATKVVQDDLAGARETVAAYRDIFGAEHYFLEVQRHGVEGQEKVNAALQGFSKEFGLRPAATNDLHYVHQHDAEAHDVLLCLQTGNRFDDPRRWRFESQDFYLKTPAEMREVFADLPDALASTLDIAAMVKLEIDLGVTLLPQFETPAGLTPEQYLRQLVADGMRWRYGENPPAGHLARMEEELSVIEATGYVGYFLIVWDFYNFARGHHILTGPGRGSAAGSIVSYVLGITDIDPIEHGLMFERFLNKDRVSMPDIDCDFSVEGRERVIRYVTDKYGSDRVAQIITFTTMASKAAIRDVGRVLDVPLKEADRLAKLVPVWQGRSKSLDDALKEVPELREAYETDLVQAPDGRRVSLKKLVDVARALEGVSRNVSVHAAGVVIAPEPLVNFAPLQYGPRSAGNGVEGPSRQVITQYDMKAVSDIGLLKMDFLGLQNLDIISTCLRLVKERRGLEIDRNKIPYDDAKTFELLAATDTHGVFQLEGSGMRRMLLDMKPARFEDVVAAVALYRPGPMQFIPAYIARKQGREPIEYLHPKLADVLADTYGVLIYQEQVMKLAQVLAGYTLSEADILRAAMGKKDKVKMAQQREKFVAGCASNGIGEATAAQIYDVIAKFAEYAFNRAHSAAYAVIAYQTAYLKANYPLEYMTSLLRHYSGNADDVAATIVDCKARGIEVLPPDVNLSHETFTIEDDRHVRFGLSAIKNVGARAVELLVADRGEGGPFASLQDLCDRAGGHQEVNRRVLESLVRSGACDSIGERNQMLSDLEDAMSVADQARRDRESGQTSLFGEAAIEAPQYRVKDVPPMSDEDKLRSEKELLGLYLSDHPLNRVAEEMARLTDARANEVTTELEGQEVRVGGLVRELRRVVTKKGQIMAYGTIEDLTGTIDVILFPQKYELYRRLFDSDQPLVIQGKVDARSSNRGSGGNGANGAAALAVEEGEGSAEAPEEVAEQASVVVDFAWTWNDPECVPVERRHTLHVEVPGEDPGVVDQVTSVLSRHPGEDEVFLHFFVSGREVVVQAGDRYHVSAGPALAGELEGLLGGGAARLVAVRPRAPSSSRSNGSAGNGRGL